MYIYIHTYKYINIYIYIYIYIYIDLGIPMYISRLQTATIYLAFLKNKSIYIKLAIKLFAKQQAV